MEDFKRIEGESEYEYVYRIGSNKALIGTWQDIADILNEELGYEYTESRYRKMFQALERMAVKQATADGKTEEFLQKKLEMEKERVRLRDERGEISRIIREQARKETFLELVKQAIADSVMPLPGNMSATYMYSGDNDVIVHLTDIHAGLATKNFVNQYDGHIMRERLHRYLQKVVQVQTLHGSENCYLLLGGDLISGLIHSNLRLENNLNVIQQVMDVSAAICEFVDELSHHFGAVNIYSVAGNHSRCLPKKEDNFKGENLDSIVPWYLEAAMANYPNVLFHKNEVEESIAIFCVRGQLVYGVHGDKDSVSSVVQNLTMFLGEKPNIVMAGHRHTNGVTTVSDTKVIESGCVSGPDNFCMDHRLRNKPEQSIVVVTEQGVDCVYDVSLDG